MYMHVRTYVYRYELVCPIADTAKLPRHGMIKNDIDIIFT